ncbi:MAG: MerR family transcriptional regulator [Actinobacteria bacterium]|nr:MAG: MerR family transcriptional regulator [Actinomycetota bacterium]
MEGMTVGEAAAQTGWSPRMLRYLEAAELVVPRRTANGYRAYGLLELNQLRSLLELRGRFGVELTDVAFAARLDREPALRAAVETWLAGTRLSALDWEQRKHERLLAA